MATSAGHSTGEDPPAALADAAEELYGLVPEEFTAARDARAKAARSAGDRDLATAVRALRRPSVAAWAVNQLVRRHADVVGQLTRLGAAMREAQLSLAGAELRALTAEQKELTASVRALVAQDADAAGVALSDAAGEQVVQTLRAALADEDAAVAVRSGRLTTHLEHTGFGPVDLDGAVAVPRAAPRPVETGPAPPPEPGPPAEAERERAERERAERERVEREEVARKAVERAEREAADAAQALEEAEARAREARDAEAAAVERVHALEAQLREARAERDDAATSQHAATADRDAAARAAREADTATQRARHHLATLSPP